MSGGTVSAIRRKPATGVPVSERGATLSPRSLSIGLGAVIVAASEHEPRVLTIRQPRRGGGSLAPPARSKPSIAPSRSV